MADYTIDKFSYGGNNYNFDYSRIPFGKVDSTSTSTAFTATVDGITELKDGVCLFLMNGVVTSASGFTININNLGAKPVYQTMAEESRATTLFNKAYTGFLVYNSQRVSGGCWDFYYGYNSNDNYLAYQVRRQNGALFAKTATGRYQFLFTEDESHLLSTHTTANSTSTTKTLTSLPFDPFGPIYYYYSTSNVSADATYAPSALYTQCNTCDYRYAFNVSASVNSFTASKAIYLKVTPQDNGKVILASTSDPLVQDLPTTEDGYWYIYLGVAYSTYQGTLDATHPVYIYKNGGARTVSGYSATSPVITSTTIKEALDGSDYDLDNFSKLKAIGTEGPITVTGLTNNVITSSAITIKHATSGVGTGDQTFGTTSTAALTPSFGDNFSVPGFTTEGYGHIKAAGAHNVKIPNAVATTATAGLMSAADKQKFDNITGGQWGIVGWKAGDGTNYTSIQIDPYEYSEFRIYVFLENEAYLTFSISSFEIINRTSTSNWFITNYWPATAGNGYAKIQINTVGSDNKSAIILVSAYTTNSTMITKTTAMYVYGLKYSKFTFPPGFDLATPSSDGLMSATDKGYLDALWVFYRMFSTNRFYSKNTSTTLAAGNWTVFLTGQIPANTTGHVIYYRISCMANFGSIAQWQYRGLRFIIQTTDGGTYTTPQHMTTVALAQISCEKYEYYWTSASGDPALSVTAVAYSSQASALTDQFLMIEPVGF